jgi:hypothetical protein
MTTKTQDVFGKMDYFLALKDSGGVDNEVSSDIFKDLCDIFVNQVKNGLKTGEEIEDFGNTLPVTSEMFTNPHLHNNLAVLKPRFKESIKIIDAEKEFENNASLARVA